jgi:sec-independent protein translocase protein TatB
MFEVGFTEIVLIFGIALLVLGPKRLPKLAADVGRWAGRARSMARQLRTQLEQEVQFDPLQDDARATPMAPATATPTIHAALPAEPIEAAATPSTEPMAEPAAATSDERQAG